jgi:hypothetical protein
MDLVACPGDYTPGAETGRIPHPLDQPFLHLIALLMLFQHPLDGLRRKLRHGAILSRGVNLESPE